LEKLLHRIAREARASCSLSWHRSTVRVTEISCAASAQVGRVSSVGTALAAAMAGGASIIPNASNPTSIMIFCIAILFSPVSESICIRLNNAHVVMGANALLCRSCGDFLSVARTGVHRPRLPLPNAIG
jgi:hypothetical protein